MTSRPLGRGTSGCGGRRDGAAEGAAVRWEALQLRRGAPPCGGRRCNCGEARRRVAGGVATAARRAAVWRETLQLRRGAPPCGGRRCNCGEARRSAVRGAAGRPRVAAGEPDASAMLRVTPSFFVPTLRGHTFVLCPDP